jgi:NAD(P)-dependent dehydrogenase (short-subunit alcohol dehydrogenase family)
MTATRPRRYVITGGSRGLGLALTRALAARGDEVVVDARGGDALRGVTRHLTRVTGVVGDIADAAHRTELAAHVGNRPLDGLVLSAGILGPSPLPAVDDLQIADFREVLELNVVAQLGLLQALAGSVRPGGAIVAVTSDAAREPYEGWGAYGASKAALEQLVHVFGAEHPQWRVYRADPGDLRTAMHQAAFPTEDISDRPPPQVAVPGLLALLDGELASGRYEVADLASANAGRPVATG